jgi:hypothetical protein
MPIPAELAATADPMLHPDALDPENVACRRWIPSLKWMITERNHLPRFSPKRPDAAPVLTVARSCGMCASAGWSDGSCGLECSHGLPRFTTTMLPRLAIGGRWARCQPASVGEA